MAAHANPVKIPVPADRRISSVASLCEQHGVKCGSVDCMVGFVRAIHENKLLAMEFWRIVAAITDEDCGSATTTECVNQVVLELIAKGVTGQGAAGVLAAGRGPRAAVSELASLLAGEDIGGPVVVEELPRRDAVEVKDDVHRKDYGKEQSNGSSNVSGNGLGDSFDTKAVKVAKPAKSAKDAGEGMYFKYSKLIQYAAEHPEERFGDKDARPDKDATALEDSKPRIEARDAPPGKRGESAANVRSSNYAEYLKGGTDGAEPEVREEPRRKATGYPAIPPSLWQCEESFHEKVREESRHTIAEPIRTLPPPVSATYVAPQRAATAASSPVAPIAATAPVQAAPIVAAAPAAAIPTVDNVEGVEPDRTEAMIPLSLVVESYRRRMRAGMWIVVILAIGCGMVMGAMLACGYGSQYWWQFDSWVRRNRYSSHDKSQNLAPRVNGSLAAGIGGNGDGLRIQLSSTTTS